MALPTYNFTDSALSRLQSSWKSQLDPLLGAPLSNCTILKGVVLKSGINVINTLLGRQAQGWVVSDLNAAVTIYRSAAFNELTLTLTSSGAATVNLVIY